MCLGYLLPKLMPTQCQETLCMVSLCLHFEQYLRKFETEYFQEMSVFSPVKVTKLSQKVMQSLLKKAFEEMQSGDFSPYSSQNSIFDYRLETLLLHYDKLLKRCDPTYSAMGSQNLWLVKPMAASRGKGINFFHTKQYKESLEMAFEKGNAATAELRTWKINNKYSNKIVQKYIEKPFLIQPPPPTYIVVKKKVLKRRLKNINKVEE